MFQFLSCQIATNVSEYNVTALMHEIMTGETYVPPKIDDKKAKHEKATLHEVKEEEEDEKEAEELKNAEERVVDDAKRETQGKWSKIVFLSLSASKRARISTTNKPHREGKLTKF